MRQRLGVFARIGLRPHRGARAAGVDADDLERQALALVCPGAGQRLDGSLGGRVRRPERTAFVGQAEVRISALPWSDFCSKGSTERISRHVAVTLTVITFSKVLASTWPIGEIVPSTPALATRMSSLPQRSKIAPPSASMAPMSARSKGTKRGAAADGLDGIVEIFKAADGAGAGHHMRAGLGQFERREIADAARSAGDDSDATCKIDAHHSPLKSTIS
jgi:hypothetical protein